QRTRARLGSMTQDACLVAISAVFFAIHAQHVVVGHSLTSVFFAAEQAVLVVMFLTRRRSSVTSVRVQDWAVAAVGGWLTLALRPVGSDYSTVVSTGIGVQMLGLAATIVCFCYLGRSFGIVAANRGIKMRGPYTMLRHPIYVAEYVTTIGFLMSNFAVLNIAIAVVVGAAQVARVHSEERVLSASPEYRAYRSQVRWRLVPHVY